MDRYRQIVELSDDCIKEIDLDGVVRAVNGKGLALLHASEPSDVLNRAWVELWPLDSQSLVLDAINRARSGEVATFEATCPVFSGELRDWWVRVSPLLEDGIAVGLLAVSSDITARNRAVRAAEVLQQALAARTREAQAWHQKADATDTGVVNDLQSRLMATNLAYQELEVLHHEAAEGRRFAVAAQRAAELIADQAQKGEAVGQLLAGVVHDLNNFLQSAVSAVDLVLDSGELSERSSRYLKIAEASLEQGTALSQRLIGFARRHPYKPEPVDLSGMIQSMAPLLKQAVGKKARLEIAVLPELCCAMVDRNTLERALLNLVINARDASQPGDQIRIESGSRAITADDSVTGLTEGTYVTLVVEDTGEGMSKEVQARLFEVYFTTKPVGEGSGLGLAQVHSAVRQAGGHVIVNSVLGQGTRFELLFPRISEG